MAHGIWDMAYRYGDVAHEPGLVNAYAYAHASEKILNASRMRMRQ